MSVAGDSKFLASWAHSLLSRHSAKDLTGDWTLTNLTKSLIHLSVNGWRWQIDWRILGDLSAHDPALVFPRWDVNNHTCLEGWLVLVQEA